MHNLTPLTPEYIEAHIGPDEGDREAVHALVREVEKAHGIDSTRPSFLFIAMGDDGIAHPTYCGCVPAVRDALKDTLYFLMPGEDLSEEDVEMLNAQFERLMEDGELRFEGDSPLYLFRL